MKKFVALALLVLLFGCISETNPAANVTHPANVSPSNTTPPANTSANVTPPPIAGNITEAPKPSTNQTAPENDSNVTPPPPAPENPPGLAFGGGRYLLVLDDASVVPSSKEPCGIFSIRLAEDYSLLDKTIICPGESFVWRDESGHAFRIFVVKVAAGYSGTGSWVDVRIYG
ncbi:MAG TPA: hypothetical protein VLD37_00010 [Candidatus Bilamarchaeum sp.]|nr:hypothetical protein [Candidatus Bilamarchaeum sp.]